MLNKYLEALDDVLLRNWGSGKSKAELLNEIRAQVAQEPLKPRNVAQASKTMAKPKRFAQRTTAAPRRQT